ncbi:sugar MFS transporter [Planomicrobium sp. CPCC 101110]|uniref:MFS transporter n=1 Tax=Planomicrobium sp. CPCC 101110 TaxID=2599619 RepID=UPI0011B4D18E|nr:MFS transporter [Planomicrobium sp. CPCC 101110]TWT27079.1 MFS transporter [Planomicrobium sp. CPCC 101110]
MAAFFIIIIYLAFISLGLPDSLLGVTWPVMQPEFGAPLETAGLLFMAMAGGTIASSLASGAMLKRFGTGKVAFVSSFMTAAALLGFYFSPSLVWLFLCAIPLGLGAGAIDAGLNHYVASHYKAHHMNWLHCFWGVGATLGPVVMASVISGDSSWRNGYLAIAGIQFVLVIILFFSLPLWDRIAASPSDTEKTEEESKGTEAIKPMQIKGVKLTLAAFLFYCGAESAIGLWGSSFLVNAKGLSVETAAKWVSLYFGGITLGRFVTGFLSLKVSNRTLIRAGQLTALAGALLLLFPFPASFSLAGFVLTGLGLAPIFPGMLHETPAHFGRMHAQSIMGYQMAVAYTGSLSLPPLLGFLASQSTIAIFPFVVAFFIAAMLLSSEMLNAFFKKKPILSGEKKKPAVF